MRGSRILSPQNDRLKSWIKLQKDGAERRERGEFVLEGRRLVASALDSGLLKTFLYADKLAKDDALIDEARSKDVEVLMLSLVAFRKLAAVPSPQGVACVARLPAHSPEDIFGEDALILVACGVQEPGNLGTMIRSAQAAGASGFVALPPSADLFHPRAVRGSAGAVLSLPAVRMKEQEFVARAAASGMRVLAAAPVGGADYRTADYSRPLAIAIGSEAHGVPGSVAGASTLVTIPMPGGGESLNAAAAAAILLFEAARDAHR
jgi:TrmH family RNA methyltransferase